MRPVHLNTPLVLEARAGVPDGAGGEGPPGWVVLGTLWAELRLRTGGERAEAGLALSRLAWRVVVRAAGPGAASRPVPGQRFRAGARLLAIEAVAMEDPAGRYLTCFCREEGLA
ncbi:MAG: phage tail protein [Alphaproteobacteria bacterium HGW-Alphaproteobacteria-2]|nr:MAG: phage tail protein [Alphaproteobacteria bacterium HGW-Alphaproteobacteria-2]